MGLAGSEAVDGSSGVVAGPLVKQGQRAWPSSPPSSPSAQIFSKGHWKCQEKVFPSFGE